MNEFYKEFCKAKESANKIEDIVILEQKLNSIYSKLSAYDKQTYTKFRPTAAPVVLIPEPEVKRSEPVFVNLPKIVMEEATIERCKVIISTSTALRNCEECIIDLRTCKLTTLHISNLHRCVVIVPSVDTAVTVRNCSKCKMLVNCAQFRVNECKDIRVWLKCSSGGVVEASSNLEVHCEASCKVIDYDDITNARGNVKLVNETDTKWYDEFTMKGNETVEDIKKLLKIADVLK